MPRLAVRSILIGGDLKNVFAYREKLKPVGTGIAGGHGAGKAGVDASNVFNHPNLGQPGASVPAAGATSATFGVITSANSMRKMQFGVRLTF
jgi:hypothetical protein